MNRIRVQIWVEIHNANHENNPKKIKITGIFVVDVWKEISEQICIKTQDNSIWKDRISLTLSNARLSGCIELLDFSKIRAPHKIEKKSSV